MVTLTGFRELPNMETDFRPHTRIFGPFESIVKFSGLDLTYSLLRFRECRESQKVIRAAFSNLFAVFILVVIIFKVVCIGNWTGRTFTFNWADSSIDLGIFLFGFISTVAIVFWTNGHFMMILQNKLDTLQQSPSRCFGSFRRHFIKLFIMSVIWIIFYMTHSTLRMVYRTERNVTDDMPFLRELDNTFVLDIAMNLIVVFLSCLASAIYMLSFEGVGRKMEILNEDLMELTEKEGLQRVDHLLNIADRQTEILNVIRYMNPHLGKFTTLGLMGALFVHINSIYIVVEFRPEVPVPYLIITVCYALMSGSFVHTLLMIPGQLQTKISQTSTILLYDKSIWQCADEKAVHIANAMIKRAECDELKLDLFHGVFLVDSRLPHRIAILAPLVANVMIFIGRFYSSDSPILIKN